MSHRRSCSDVARAPRASQQLQEPILTEVQVVTIKRDKANEHIDLPPAATAQTSRNNFPLSLDNSSQALSTPVSESGRHMTLGDAPRGNNGQPVAQQRLHEEQQVSTVR